MMLNLISLKKKELAIWQPLLFLYCVTVNSLETKPIVIINKGKKEILCIRFVLILLKFGVRAFAPININKY